MKEISKYFLYFISIFVAVCALMYFFYDHFYQSNPKMSLSDWGDAYGILNTFFTGCAFAGMIVALIMQRKELELQRRELEENREELKGQKEATQALRDLQQESFTFNQTEAYLRILKEAVYTSDLPSRAAGLARAASEIERYKSHPEMSALRYRIRCLFLYLHGIKNISVKRQLFQYCVASLDPICLEQLMNQLKNSGINYVDAYFEMQKTLGAYDGDSRHPNEDTSKRWPATAASS
ncbi:MAG: hypothetical protein AB7F75_05910 [Planctomycetota bacterium]